MIRIKGKGVVFFKYNVVCVVSVLRVKKWTVRSPKICQVLGSFRLRLNKEIRLMNLLLPYDARNYNVSLHLGV